MKKIFPIALILMAILCHSVQAQYTNASDSVAKTGFFQSKAVRVSTVPVILLASSAATWGLRKDVREMRNRYLPTFKNKYDDYTQYVPAVSVYALNLAGVKGKNSLFRATASYGLSVALMATIVNSIKYSASIERPDGSSRNSFPSGHTANSFMNATFLHKEFGERSSLYSIGGYSLATATALGRQLNNRHWVSDVLAGAGIGILSTEVGYIMADHIFKEKGQNFRKRDPRVSSDKPSFLEIKLGFSDAIHQDIAKKSIEIDAKRGFNMGIDGAWFLTKNIGIGANYGFSSFPINQDQAQVDDEDLKPYIEEIYTQPMGIKNIHIGPYFSFPLPHNWFVTSSLTGGRSKGANGEILLRLTPDIAEEVGVNEVPFFKYEPSHSWSWSTHLGIQKRLKPNFAVKLYGTYFHSKNDFTLKVLDDIEDNGTLVYTSLGSEKVLFHHISVGIGLTAFLW